MLPRSEPRASALRPNLRVSGDRADFPEVKKLLSVMLEKSVRSGSRKGVISRTGSESCVQDSRLGIPTQSCMSTTTSTTRTNVVSGVTVTPGPGPARPEPGPGSQWSQAESRSGGPGHCQWHCGHRATPLRGTGPDPASPPTMHPVLSLSLS
eukprot:1997213-Rhodomonas_salina.1